MVNLDTNIFLLPFSGMNRSCLKCTYILFIHILFKYLPRKNLKRFSASNPFHEKNNFLKTIHRKEPARKETYGTKSLWLFTYLFLSFIFFKSTLMQISQYPYMFVIIWKYSENFAFLICIILEIFTCKFCISFKESSLLIDMFYCFCMFAKKHFSFQKYAYLKN